MPGHHFIYLGGSNKHPFSVLLYLQTGHKQQYHVLYIRLGASIQYHLNPEGLLFNYLQRANPISNLCNYNTVHSHCSWDLEAEGTGWAILPWTTKTRSWKQKSPQTGCDSSCRFHIVHHTNHDFQLSLTFCLESTTTSRNRGWLQILCSVYHAFKRSNKPLYLFCF